MKQITPEIKARVFALYWGQKIWTEKSNPKCLDVVDAYIDFDPYDSDDFDDAVLLVKQLSSITDEDAIELNKMHNWTKGVHETKYWYQDEADYLRSKGYALPAFGYSVDELVEAGVFKIKEVNND